MRNKMLLLSFLWYSVVFSQIDYSKYEGSKGKIRFFKEYSFSNIYDYSIDSEQKDSLITKVIRGNNPEALISKKYSSKFSQSKTESTSFKIKLKTRLIVTINNTKHSLISYKSSDNNKVIITDYYLDDDSTFKENTRSNDEINLLKSILENSNANLLFEFYNRRNNENYPEINKLKSQAKNSDGILDIKKLAKVLEENKAILSKYLDE
ncbi:hypothetical protein [Aquimarina agarilytica]|uniref:hypothetical protein n=1 Tax=Aquimarina agarilytica TaxID=1087449 RepID=UPI000287E6A0|nr:hypothetical protein [Aquimarina agarilytica]